MDSQKEIKIKILKVSNPIYWYNKHLGEIFTAKKFTISEVWVSERDEYKCLNFVRNGDYEVVKESNVLTERKIMQETQQNKVQVLIKVGNSRAKIPTYATDGSGCFDIYPDMREDDFLWLTKEGDVANLTTGLFFEIPEGKALMIYSRSGQGFNHNTRLSNSVGVLDSDYRGELKVKLRMDSNERAMRISADTAIAQGMIIDVPKVEFITAQELSETGRGTGGFGSTDKKVK